MDGTAPELTVNARTGTAIADENGLDLGNGPVGTDPVGSAITLQSADHS